MSTTNSPPAGRNGLTLLAIMAGVLAAGIGFWFARPRGNDAVLDAGAAALHITLDARAWRTGTDGLPLLSRLAEWEVLPLHAGDYIRIEAATNRPAYYY